VGAKLAKREVSERGNADTSVSNLLHAVKQQDGEESPAVGAGAAGAPKEKKKTEQPPGPV